MDLPERLEKVLDCLVAVRDKWDMPVLVSTHPQTRIRLEALCRKDLERITFHEPIGYLYYNKGQLGARCVISDSGTISEESVIVGFRAVGLRYSIERPEALEAGSLLISGLNSSMLVQCINVELASSWTPVTLEGYGPVNFSERVLKFVLSTVEKHQDCKGLRF